MFLHKEPSQKYHASSAAQNLIIFRFISQQSVSMRMPEFAPMVERAKPRTSANVWTASWSQTAQVKDTG